MKSILITAFAICFAAAVPTALWAADEHKEQGGGHGAPAARHESAPVQHTAPSGGGMRGGERTMSDHRATPGRTGGTQVRTREHDTTQIQGGGMTGASRTESRGTSHDRHTTTGGTTGSHATSRDSGRAATGTRSNVDVSSYRKNITAHHRYHYGNYRAPQGYAYHRYSYGDRLPDGYFGRDFWIVDFGDYGLREPPDGYVWVRYGPDAVLIDEDTGEIVEIVYDQFY